MTRIIADTEMMAQVASQAQQQANHLNTTLQQLSSAVGRLNSWEGASHYEFSNDWSSVSHQLRGTAAKIEHLGNCLQITANNFRTTDEQSAAWSAAGGGGGGGADGGGGGRDGAGGSGVNLDQLLNFFKAQGGNIFTLLEDPLKKMGLNPLYSFGLGALLDLIKRDDGRGLFYDATSVLASQGLQKAAGLIPWVGAALLVNAGVQLSGSLLVAGEGAIASSLTSDPELLNALNSSTESLKASIESADITKPFDALGNVATDLVIGQFTGNYGSLGADSAQFAVTAAHTATGVIALGPEVLFNATTYGVVAADDVAGALPIPQDWKNDIHAGATVVADTASQAGHNVQSFVSDVNIDNVSKGAQAIWHAMPWG